MIISKGVISGTVGGTLLSMVHGFSMIDVGRTIVLAMVGATVSFFVSMFLRWIVKFARSKLK